jgi:hypothetical protein
MFVERTQTICPGLCYDRDQMGSGRGQPGLWSVIFSVPVFVVRREKARFLSGLSLIPPGNFRSSR